MVRFSVRWIIRDGRTPSRISLLKSRKRFREPAESFRNRIRCVSPTNGRGRHSWRRLTADRPPSPAGSSFFTFAGVAFRPGGGWRSAAAPEDSAADQGLVSTGFAFRERWLERFRLFADEVPRTPTPPQVDCGHPSKTIHEVPN